MGRKEEEEDGGGGGGEEWLLNVAGLLIDMIRGSRAVQYLVKVLATQEYQLSSTIYCPPGGELALGLRLDWD